MSREQAMRLGKRNVEFLAARVKRLCTHFGFPIPDKDDRFIVDIAASLIGGVLTKLELEKRNAPDLEQQTKDAARMDWLETHHGWLEQRRVGHKKPTWAARNPSTNYEYQTYYSAREAIDAAIIEQELNK